MPRSARGSRAHRRPAPGVGSSGRRLGSARRRRADRLRRRRPRRPRARIASVVERGGRRSVTRSRWRVSRATSRRAASSTSTVAASPGLGVAHRVGQHRGQPGLAGQRQQPAGVAARLAGVPSGPPWQTTSTTSASRRQPAPPGVRAASRARSGRPAEQRPTDVGAGPSSTTSGQARRRRPGRSRARRAAPRLADRRRRAHRAGGCGDQPAQRRPAQPRRAAPPARPGRAR